MNWNIASIALFSVVGLLILCFIGATVELELHKRKEAKKWRDWADRIRGGKKEK